MEISPELIERIAAGVAQGDYPEVAAGALGVPRHQWGGWLTRARAGDEPYASLMALVARAWDASEQELRREVRQADPRRWSAIAWLLERSHPERWGRLERQPDHGLQPITQIRVVFEGNKVPAVSDRVLTEIDVSSSIPPIVPPSSLPAPSAQYPEQITSSPDSDVEQSDSKLETG